MSSRSRAARRVRPSDEELRAAATGNMTPSERQEFRQFVTNMRFSRGRTIEMRLGLLAGIALGLRVFYSNLINTDTAYSIFLFLGLLVLVIVMSTWLDYFPTKIKGFTLRESDGQGLPIGCLFCPMVCLGVMCYATDNQPELIPILSVYLTVSCVLSMATIAITMIYSISFPNSVAVYNFIAMALVASCNAVVGTPYLTLIIAVVLYSILFAFLLHNFPESFTLCEAMLVSQSLSLLLTDTITQLLSHLDWYTLDTVLDFKRPNSIVFLEIGVAGVFLCCVLLSPLLFMLALTDDTFYIHVWSVAFLQVSAIVIYLGVLPWLQMILGDRPVVWLFNFIMSTSTRKYLLIYCISVTLVAILIVLAQSSAGRFLSCCRADEPSSLWMRKWFHLLALAVYTPCIALDPAFISVAASLALVVFLSIEIVRVFRIWPFGDTIHKLLVPFIDSRDAGDLIVTHTYLLIGFSLPLWLYPANSGYSGVAKLGLYAGVLSLGIGDSIAAVSGTLMGRNKWPGTNKTFEGTFMSFICQLIVAAAIVFFDPHIPSLSLHQWLILAFTVAGGAALEAYTKQVDNLILGAYQFTLAITFLH